MCPVLQESGLKRVRELKGQGNTAFQAAQVCPDLLLRLKRCARYKAECSLPIAWLLLLGGETRTELPAQGSPCCCIVECLPTFA
jgi:hypothetical protein